ncbi:MAG: hypothetical protein NTU41_03875 [Chloroflexi bacterium]|nr:hypothetical protein [Chloroflexota bacterium]
MKRLGVLLSCLILFLAIGSACGGAPEETYNPPTSGGQFVLYEGNDATQDVVCTLSADTDDYWHFKNHSGWNDEARSVKLKDVQAFTILTVYDDPEGGDGDDWTQIKVKEYCYERVIGTFETSFEDSQVKVTYHSVNGLDGKISYAKVTVF